MAYDTIILERPAEGVALLTLNRPDRGNGVVPELVADLLHAFNTLEADFSVRVLTKAKLLEIKLGIQPPRAKDLLDIAYLRQHVR